MAGRRNRQGGGDQPRPRLEIEDPARGRLVSRFSDAIRQGRRQDVGFLVNLLGGRGRGGGTGRLADQIAAETGENRRTVLRRIQRALKREDKGQRAKPVDKGSGVVDRELRKNAARIVASGHGTGGSIHVTMKFWLRVSDEPVATERTASVTLRGGAQQAFAEAIENGAYEDAAHIVFDHYWTGPTDNTFIDDFGEINF